MLYRMELIPVREEDTRPGDLVITADEESAAFGQITRTKGIRIWGAGWMARSAIRRHQVAQRKRRRDEVHD